MVEEQVLLKRILNIFYALSTVCPLQYKNIKIQYKIQKCKGIHSIVQAEIIEIDSFHPADKKKCWEPILVLLILL